MSAITAIYYLDKKPLPTSLVGKVLDSMKHRGGDGVGVWVDKNVGLGHRMRWTTEESLSETLPLKNAESKCVLTCDARIDNRAELIPQLSFNGKKEKEITDSEIIAAAYEKWGEDCLPKLIGEFVFAIWNPNTRQLFCARDPLGVKHFYYYYEPRKLFALASEIKALFCLPGIPRELNEENIGDYLVLNFEDKENTPFKQIKRLPSTRAMVIDAEQCRIWQYWQPDPSRQIRLRNHREYHEAFREKFTEAISARLRSAYPVGAMLSGGLDSSSIVCVASRLLDEQNRSPLHTFSAIFPTVSKADPRIDERPYMHSVIAKSGCQPHFVNCDDDNPWKDIKELIWHADNPVGISNMYIHWEIFKEAQKNQVRVLFDGFDGDSTVSHGYEELSELSNSGRWVRLLKEAFLLNKNMPHPMHSLSNVKKMVLRKGLDYAVPVNLAKIWYLMTAYKRKGQKSKKGFQSLPWQVINSEFKEKFDLEERYGHFQSLNFPANASSSENHWHGLTSGLFAKSLEFVELASQKFGIEQRFPFFDRRLIEFCLALPIGERIYNGWTRAIFRYAMTGVLPKDVQWRPTKANLGSSIRLNMTNHGSLEADEALNKNSKLLQSYLDIEKLRNIRQRFIEDPLKRSGHECLILIAAVHLSAWLRENDFTKGESKASG